jgi:hypothetical protein
MMSDDLIREDVAKLMAVILKDRFLREKLILTEEFNAVARHIAPEMDSVVAILAMRRKNGETLDRIRSMTHER